MIAKETQGRCSWGGARKALLYMLLLRAELVSDSEFAVLTTLTKRVPQITSLPRASGLRCI